jgi:ABC-type multidrug transport system ATPase subunit
MVLSGINPQMLSIERLSKIYPGQPAVTALSDVTLEIGEGMFGLLGPNGAGKSTLMKILAGLLEATSGRVMLDDLDLSIPEHRSRHYERLGYLPQDFGLHGHLTGERMLYFLLELKGVNGPRGRKALVSELLERVNLAQAAKKRVREYSGGMRQRLGIAQALAGNPRLIIVDEPTAGLDPEERLRFYRLLSELAAGRIILLSTHIVEDVSTLCPRFAVIRKGRLVALTTPKAAREALIGKIYEGVVDQQRLDEIRTSHHVIQAMIFEGLNKVRVHLETGEPPVEFQPVSPTLEDAYFISMKMQSSGVNNGGTL